MAPIDDLLSRMDALLQPMRASGDQRQHFLATYMRTTLAVKHEIERGGFVDDAWTVPSRITSVLTEGASVSTRAETASL